MRGETLIAEALTAAGLDAREIDGWVYVLLPDGLLLWIGAWDGVGLDAHIYDEVPEWFGQVESTLTSGDPTVLTGPADQARTPEGEA